MNDFISSLNHWQALQALSYTMLNLAHSGKWDELIEQEIKYVTLVEQIARHPLSPGNALHQEKAKEILASILANEAELKSLLKGRMEELRELIDHSGKQKSLTNTYGELSGNVLFPLDFNQ
ncbi:Flagellar protein FliT [Cedecea lapagei]|uniref:Flagellar protein FliT n=1 Tax=Cedecea lapagei TaxID=158823 RepID=A0A3S4MEH9_9ENTR|nr:flagella biosynthesis regulatory protein FliT [Cedecea lapagei]VEB96515.1 Flagellar protein FliT [Cedecea lapagei]